MHVKKFTLYSYLSKLNTLNLKITLNIFYFKKPENVKVNLIDHTAKIKDLKNYGFTVTELN